MYLQIRERVINGGVPNKYYINIYYCITFPMKKKKQRSDESKSCHNVQ